MFIGCERNWRILCSSVMLRYCCKSHFILLHLWMVFFNEAEYAAASNVHDCGIITFHNHDEYTHTHTHTCQILCVWLTHIFSRTVAKGFYTNVCSSFFHTPLSVFTLSHTHTPAEVNSADYWFTQPTTQQHRWPAPGSLPFSSYSTRERRMGEAEEKKTKKKRRPSC